MSPDSKKNRLLAALPQEEYERLLPHLEPLVLELKQVLFEPNQPIEFVYFLLNGVISLFVPPEDDTFIEVGTIGNEGMVGLPVFLGADQIPGRAICQIPGNAMRMRAVVFQREVTSGMVLYGLLHRYTQAMFNQTAQTAACNRLHSIEERFCRWILMTHDRVESDVFVLTQEFLSQMLGVRRASVSKVASVAQGAGLIQYKRGNVTILDREGIEETACDCYRIIKAEYDRLVGGLGQ
jgi:CRP-like cAMP-binding protein